MLVAIFLLSFRVLFGGSSDATQNIEVGDYIANITVEGIIMDDDYRTEMLEKIADFYESDVDDVVSRLSSIIEPVIIVVLGIVIGIIVVAIMIPMFDVITNVSNL